MRELEDGFAFGEKACNESLPTMCCKSLPHHARESLSLSSYTTRLPPERTKGDTQP
jgi:hypothetical protein